jgi:hypothetical protein
MAGSLLSNIAVFTDIGFALGATFPGACGLLHITQPGGVKAPKFAVRGVVGSTKLAAFATR